MRRPRNNNSNEQLREQRTMVPAFDPKELAAQIEEEANAVTSRPPFDPSAYARQAEGSRGSFQDMREAETVTDRAVLAELAEADAQSSIDPSLATDPGSVLDPASSPIHAMALDDTLEPDTQTEAIGREMYSSYLASDFPEALVLAERVLEREPQHAMAQLVADRCRERLQPTPSPSTNAGRLSPSSIVRLKFAELERQSRHIDMRTSFVLGHVDGVTDVGMVAALSGLPPPEALDRLHALLTLGVIEVVA